MACSNRIVEPNCFARSFATFNALSEESLKSIGERSSFGESIAASHISQKFGSGVFVARDGQGCRELAHRGRSHPFTKAPPTSDSLFQRSQKPRHPILEFCRSKHPLPWPPFCS